MKKIFSIFTIVFIIASCSKDDAPNPVYIPSTKVIDKIEIQYTNVNSIPENYTTFYEYNTNKEVSKITLFRNGQFNSSYAYNFVNNIPVSSNRVYYQNNNIKNDDLIYNYNDGIFKSVFYPTYNELEEYSYNQQTNEYENIDTGSKFKINTDGDIYQKELYGDFLTYNFDTSKKGPLYNVANKKWVAMLWYISDLHRDDAHVATTIPVTSMQIDNTTTVSYTNTYDADGFVKTSSFSAPNAIYTTEIVFTYKLI